MTTIGSNNRNQPIGSPVPNWKPPARPRRKVMEGKFCRLEPLDPAIHAEGLFASNQLDEDGSNWTYLSYGPFETLSDYRQWLEDSCTGDDPLFFAIRDFKSDMPVGLASYLRIAPEQGSIEVGHLNFSPKLQKTAAATEAMFLMMEHAFTLGYRRYEWKCDALNAPSRAAALRLGFSLEGVFRQHIVTKGRNRDSAWYSAIDSEWPAIRDAFRRWLGPDNFDVSGCHRERLSDLNQALGSQMKIPNKPKNVAILIFDDVEILDFCGPFEVFSVANRDTDPASFHVYTVARKPAIRTRGGLVVNSHYRLNECPRADILLIPGGSGVRKVLEDPEIMKWTAGQVESADIVSSVCTGALLLGRCGLLDGLEATTHYQCIDELRTMAPSARVLTDRRFVDTGKVITSAGIAAGIDMCLHIVGRIGSPAHAKEVAAYMEYPYFEENVAMEIHENPTNHLEAFISLNERWIAEYFEIEDSDRKLASDPAAIWREGGWIFTATINDRVAGCCALFKKGPDVFELARMTVDPQFQRRGIGRKLAEHAMRKLEEIGAEKVELLTNTALEPAVELYRSLGFETTAEGRHPDYSRCNLIMTKSISK